MPQIIENMEINSPATISGEAWNDAVFRRVHFHGIDGDGLVIRGASGVTVEDCIFEDISGSAIRLSNTGSCPNTTIQRNRIRRIGRNGIAAGVGAGIDHPGLVIRDNRIRKTGQASPGQTGLLHGIYVQATDALIELNAVIDADDGNGISVRSSAAVRKNFVKRTAQSGIAYFADHPAGSGPLVITSNIVKDTGLVWTGRGDIDLLNVRPADVVNLISAVLITDNYIAGSGVSVGTGYVGVAITQDGNNGDRNSPLTEAEEIIVADGTKTEPQRRAARRSLLNQAFVDAMPALPWTFVEDDMSITVLASKISRTELDLQMSCVVNGQEILHDPHILIDYSYLRVPDDKGRLVNCFLGPDGEVIVQRMREDPLAAGKAMLTNIMRAKARRRNR